MSAWKLSRFTGLVLVLAAFVGGVGAHGLSAEHANWGSMSGAVDHITRLALADADETTVFPADYDWS